jgi:glycosyltransferase involved in cell wall biosynthesis
VKVIFFANTDWYLFNFRLSLARALRDQGAEVVLLSPPGPYGAMLRDAGFRWEPLAMNRRSLNPFRECGLLRTLAKFYRQERPDIVQHFTVKCVIYGSFVAAWSRVPFVVNAVAGVGYVFTNSGTLARLLRPIVGRALRLAINRPNSRLILQNPDDVRLFRSAGLVDDRNVRLIMGSGVDTTRFFPASCPVLTHGPARILLASRVLWDKGVGEFVEAARMLSAEGLSVRFRLAGSPDPGNPGSVPATQLSVWMQEGLVEFLGQVADMPALLRDTDIMVLPTRYGEGLPKSLIEAAACAIPLVTTDIPGCREVVSDGETGLLVPVRDADALAGAIRKLCSDPEWARGLGRAARERALREFDERVVIAKTLAVYREGGLNVSESVG